MKSYQNDFNSFVDFLSKSFNVVYKNVTDYGFREDIDVILEKLK